MKAYKARRARSGLIVLGIFLVGETLFYAAGNDVAVAIAKGVWWFAQRPMGIAGLAFLAFNGALVGHAYFETVTERRRALTAGSQKQLVPVALSADDKDVIARLRKLWFDEGGRESLNYMLRLLEEVHEQLKDKYYAGMFQALSKNLEDEDGQLVEALQGGTTGRGQVVAAFESVFKVFLAAAEKLYEAHAVGDIRLHASPYIERYRRLRGSYRVFNNAVVETNNYPGIDRRLHVFARVEVGPLASRKFLGEQPWDSPNEPNLDEPTP